MSTRYHQAAIDGYLDLLKEATRKDLNTTDEDGMTPTLLAAYHGHLEVLELVCSRGGNPDKCDMWGNTSLHHAATNGHIHCVSFLVNFGANIFAMDNDLRTPLDAAVGRDRNECVMILDRAATNQNTMNPKKVSRLKEQAKKDAIRQIKECEKIQAKHQNEMTKNYNKGKFGTLLSAKGTVSGAHASHSETLGSLSLTETLRMKLKKKDKNTVEKNTVNNVIFMADNTPGRTRALDVFNEKHEDELSDDFHKKNSLDGNSSQAEQESIFKRPGLGNIVFRRNLAVGINADLEEMSYSPEDVGSKISSELFHSEEQDLASEADADNDLDLPWNEEDMGLDDNEPETAPLLVFLASHNLSELVPAMTREKIDLDALMLCSDGDLQSVHIQLGPRKKILNAVEKRKQAFERPGKIVDTVL
ncbi:ankyrin repeat and SAM domain-containing protein 4B [Ambystoma mexicanum]|uniref:ankyrin repeat and SAM domain-containing protein 4B n=1 Tax=Ambystoma mexicanum TaxID=8296 RepID=UPI0037E73F1F